MSCFDFLKEYSRKVSELIRNRNIQEYAILKCGFEKDENFYQKCIQSYKNRQIAPNEPFINWFLPKISRKNTILLKIKFTVIKPFISKDDDIFYPKDNPICKDKVFKIPMMRASSWKGALRYAVMKYVLESNNNEEKIERRLVMLRLFGTERDNIEKYLDRRFKEYDILEKWKEEVEKLKKKLKVRELNLRGRLIFFPTFFDQIDLDVIAPHDRKTKTVTERGPILFEVVPENTKGEFCLLYYPFNLIEKLNSEKRREAVEEIIEDFEMIKEIIPEMIQTYGFGAKTSSGYGIGEIKKVCIYFNNKKFEIGFDKILEVVKNEYGK